jgi:hypothetical protein
MHDGASRYVARFLISLIWECVTEHGRDQLSLSIETSYAQGVLGGPSSNNAPRIVGQGAVTNPMEIPEAPSSLARYPPKFPFSSFEVVNQFHGHDSSLPFLSSIIKADLEGLQLESESPSPTIHIPTEEEEFLADMIGDTDKFGVRPCCLLSRPPSDSCETSFADTINPTSSSASRIVRPLAGLKNRQMQMYVVEK